MGQAPIWLHSHPASALFGGLHSRRDADKADAKKANTDKANGNATTSGLQPKKQRHHQC